MKDMWGSFLDPSGPIRIGFEGFYEGLFVFFTCFWLIVVIFYLMFVNVKLFSIVVVNCNSVCSLMFVILP